MQLVVVIAVRKAVSAATITFTAISIIRFFICTPPFFIYLTHTEAALLAHLGTVLFCARTNPPQRLAQKRTVPRCANTNARKEVYK